MNKHANAESTSQTNPEWTESMVAAATTLEESTLPEPFKQFVRRGRPPIDNAKQPISIRLSPEVLDYFRASGKGWQTRIDKILRDCVSHT